MSFDRLASAESLAHHLGSLMRIDSRLRPIADVAGPFEIRESEPGFAGIAKVICGQQLSVASARAIWGRYEALPGALDPQAFVELEEPAVRATGFSAGKYTTVRAIAEAINTGALDLDWLGTLSVPEAVHNLLKIKGIGPWTAEIYLMFGAGHPDIFPAGDLALQKAVARGLGLDARPSIKELVAIAAAWAPHRATAALLFWRYYAAIRDKEGIAF